MSISILWLSLAALFIKSGNTVLCTDLTGDTLACLPPDTPTWFQPNDTNQEIEIDYPSLPGDAATKGYDVAAYVWPAYHDDPRWHEIGLFDHHKGEWEVVQQAKPRFKGHRQPRKPLWGYQDETKPRVQQQSIVCARNHGVNTFIFDWYWFDGRPFLEDVLDKGFLHARSNEDMKFFLMWANHDANSYWDPRTNDKGHTYWEGEVDRPTFDTLTAHVIRQYFCHPNYYRIKGCPVFAIYEIGTFIDGLGGIEQAREALDDFRLRCKEAGLPGIHLMAIAWAALPATLSGVPGDDTPSQASTLQALGFESATNYQWCHLVPANCDYEHWSEQGMQYWQTADQLGVPYFPHVSLGWDPNPRYPNDGPAQPCVTDVNAARVEECLCEARAYIDAHPEQAPLVTINAWNEWSEGSCLEPEASDRYAFLNAIRNVFSPTRRKYRFPIGKF